MEALRLQDGAFVRARYEELQESRRQRQQLQPDNEKDKSASSCAPSREMSAEQRQELEQWRIVERAAALDAQGPTPQWRQKFSVLASILESLYAEQGTDPSVTSPSKMALSRPETGDGASPVPLKELPVPTQVALKMFFRTCQSLRDPAKLMTNSRLSVQIASKLPLILTTMPPCVLSPGLVDDTSVDVEDGGNISSVFYQLFRLFEELLGVGGDEESSSVPRERVCLSVSDQAAVIVAYVALALKWGRLAYLLKGVQLLLESGDELNGARFEPLGPLFRELAATSIERPQIAFGEEEQPCGYLMSFGKGDHGKLGHGQCSHVSCQEGNCTENKMVPTMIAATRDVLFCKIDSLSTHSIAITAKGEAMAWGNGDKYRLGHGSSSKEYMPRTIEFLSLKGRVRDLACGLGHTLALMESGELYAWGNGSNGRLGLGDTNDRSSPTRVVLPPPPARQDEEPPESNSASTAPVRFRHIFCGASHSLGLSWNGRAYAWGKNNQGQCGHGHTNDQWTIQEIESFRDAEEGEEEECVVFAAGGWEHTLFCTASGRVYSCGCGYKDSRRAGIPPVLGHGDCDRRLKPTLVQSLDDAHEEVVKVACGWDHSLAVTANGRVYTWGSGTNGKLGHGDEESFDIPTLVRCMDGKKVKDAKAGCEHTVFLTYDHELWTCGQGDSGRLGHGDSQTRKRPTKVELFAGCGLKPVALAVGDKYNLVLVKDADGHDDHDIDNSGISVQNSVHQVNNDAVSSHGTTNTHHGVHRAAQHKKHHDNQQISFGAKWVLEIGAGQDGKGGPATTKAVTPTKDESLPSSARGVALFIAGHIDRLASDYIADDSDVQSEKQNESSANETVAKAQSVLLPFAVDTSRESLSALLQLLRWTASCSEVKEKAARSERSGSDGSCVPPNVRMGLVLSCLRVLQLNLKRSRGVASQNAGSLFNHIHELLDTLAGQKGEDIANRFGNGARRSGGALSLSAAGSAVSQEAASALKMGFGIFFPTGIARSKLLWGILDDCKIEVPSMRTIILTDQLCKDSVMTEIFKSVTSYGLLPLSKTFDELHGENSQGKDVFDIKTLMVMLLQRCSAAAVKHLEDEAFTDFSREPDCFLRLLHVLQMHYFSIVHQVTHNANETNKRGTLDPDPAANSASQRMMDFLLEYVDALMTEALAVLKRLHKASRQHEDIITWRLNGSFFHTLLPSALECLSVLLLPDSKQEKTSENLLLVERALPSLHIMLKMLDEVSWKMHTAGDGGNQTHDARAPTHSHYLSCKSHESNWFVDLGDACAVLCGKLSCQLFYPSHVSAMDNAQHGVLYAAVIKEGSFLEERHDAVVSTDMASSGSIARILEWERLGVFEVEDELIGSADDHSTSETALPPNVHENQRFLLQLCETDFSDKPTPFLGWIASSLSYEIQLTVDISRLFTIAVSVSAWHLGLVDELRQMYELYDKSREIPQQKEASPTSKIWEMFAVAVAMVKNAPSFYRHIDSDAIANAIKFSRLLLSLQPNPAVVGFTLRSEVNPEEDHPEFWDSLEDLIKIMTSVDANVLDRSFRAREVHAALVRTGVCILHDLLRKLTTSSAKSGLLNEFVSVTCASSPMSSKLNIQRIALNGHSGKHAHKAIENLFVRLARIISSDDASFELRKKALLAWTVPLGTSKQSGVALIAKSGIMSTLIDLLLDDANVLETHSELNAVAQVTNHAGVEAVGDKMSGSAFAAESQPTKVNPVNALLFDRTPAQIISTLAWEAFCAIAWQLTRSERFVQQRSALFLRAAGSSLQDRDLLTPRSTSMSPRRRLTLPKKMVVSTIDEIIEQLIDGLFLMLKRVKARFEAIEFFSNEYEKLLRSSADHDGGIESSVRDKKCSARVFLLARPILLSHTNTQDVRIPKTCQTGNESDGTSDFTLSFWIYVEHTGVTASKHAAVMSSTNSRPNGSCVRLLAFGSDQGTGTGTDPAGSDKLATLVVFTRDAYSDHVSIGVSIWRSENAKDSWSTVLIDEHVQRGNWIHVALGFANNGQDPFRAFVGGKHSTLNNGKRLVDNSELISAEFLQRAATWSGLTAGGNVNIPSLDQGGNDTNGISLSKKINHYGFSAILDDVIITRGVLAEEMAVRMQISGTVLFRLKQQHVVEKHCEKVLQLLCQLVGGSERNSDQSSAASLPLSDRWIILFSRMLLTTCQDQDLAQVYLCYLLQDILPRAPPLPEFDIQAVAQSLFATPSSRIKRADVEELFAAFNEKSYLPSTTAARQHEVLYRLMQQHGILHGLSREKSSSGSTSDTVPFKTKLSVRFAAAIHLFQKLWSTPSWKSRMDEYSASSSSKFRSFEGPGEILQSLNKDRSNAADVYAVVNVIAGYSEEELNLHRTSTQDGATFPSPLQVCSLPFSSVFCLENSGNDQVTSIQTLMVAMLREGAQPTLSLPARSEILAKYHNDVVSVDAADRRIGSLLHLRTRVLRVLMTVLLRELNEPTATHPWHHFLLESAVACEGLLGVASSSTREYVTTVLGSDAKVAMKLRRLRVFSREVLRGGKRHRSILSAVSITDLESLQWRLWEEMSLPLTSTPLSPWWQQHNDANGKLTLEVVGGDVELSELKVTALEHFPTVKLSQANICANSGLWFFEVVVLTDGLMQIGYVDGDFTADPLQGQGVGDHTNSWAFDGFRCKKWNVNSYDYGEQWKTDDVVGVLLDTERMEISYFLNGRFLGVAFSGIPITSSSRMCPAASLNVHQSAQFNFGTLSANDGGSLAPTLGGFKHLPTLDTEDQARLRPIVYVIQSRRPFKSGGASNVDSQDKSTSNVEDLGDDWSSSSSSDDDTDDGGIVLEGSEGPSGLRRHLEPGSRDGRETRTADTNDEDAGQRRRDLVEGLTGLGFPLEWATRCATETRLPMDETGAVAWILEQMEKVGLDGASTLPSMMSVATGDGTECSSHPSVLWRTGAQLPNSVVDDSADGMATESGSFPGVGVLIPADKIDGSDASQILRVSDNQLAFISATRPGSSLTERLTAEPAQLNLFSEGDQDDQCSDDESTEAFQSSLYRQHQALHNELHLLGRSDAESTTNETDGKRGVDDLLPLSIAVDTTVFIANARQAFTSLLLLAQQEAERGVVYAMVRRLLSTDESSLKFYRVLRMAIGLDTVDPTFELGVVSDTIHSEQSLQLQKALAALLEYESQRTSDSTTEQSELNSLFKSLSQEMMSQCDRGLSLVRSKSSSKAAADPVAMQAAAVWFAWVSGIVLSFIETQASATALAFAPAVCNTAFVENLVSIVSSSSSTSKPWKYVAFRLISRILSVTHTSEGVKLQLLSSAQLANVTELFTLRRRREMHDRIFFSDVTSCLFTLLVRSTSPCSFLPSSSNPCLSDKSSVKLVVSNYSSTHVTISWEQVSPTALLAASSDDIADATNTEAEAEAESNPDIMLLEVNRCGSLYAGHSLPTDSETNSTKALPSKGTYTIRNLLPDTTYCIRVGPAQAMDGAVNTATKTGAELIVQTHPAPVFDLDNETMGKNLVAFNRNLTAKNTVNKKWHSVRASVAFDEGVHQWQVRLDTCVSKNIFIGVCTAEASMENYIGSDAYGYGFLANKAVWHNKAKLHSYGEIFKQGDIIQVTLDCNAKTLAFSRNGEYLGIAASNMHAGIGRSGANGGGDSNCKWYPAFSMYNKDDKVTLIPPPAVSGFSSKEGRPQNASTFELIEAMHDVLAYQSHVTSLQSARDLEAAKLFEKAYEAFEDWRRGQKIFREISLGQIIAINNSKAATEKYGLAAGDSVFTSKGQCTVLGEYRHELWYEVDEAGSSSLFGSTTTQLASWSLSVCREMLASPDEYPVHRHHKYKLELGSNTGGETQTVEQQDWATKPSEEEAFSYQEFVEAQERWGDSGVSAAELDAKLIAELDAIATQQASSSSWALSFADVSTALLLERIYEVHGISEERGSSQTIARIGLVLYVNRCLYNVARLALPRNINATSLGTPGSSDTLSSEQNSGKALPTMANTECNLVSPVAPLLNSPHWGLSDASDFHFISTLAARLLFASQKEKLIGEELRATKTTSRSSENLQESRDNEEGGVDNDLPVVKINYSLPPQPPFWECNSSSRRTSLRLPPSSETSIFVQLATQLAARDARQWRRESSQPFEAIPISQTFQVRVDKSSGDPSKETASQQPDEDEDDDQLQQPSSKQTARYLQVFENVVREVQSPSFPLFTPVESSRTDNRALQDELGSTLQLDINMELFSPSALAQSRVRIPQLLLWYFGFGQCLGIAWRSKVLVPLQFLSSAFWIELADPTDRVADVSGVREDRSARAAAIRAIRDGLFSIVPSRCVTLMSSNNPSLRDRLSDADVNYVARLERHATYSGPRQDRHDMFWKVVGAFTSLERRMLEQFINPDRRTEMKQLESKTESPSAFVLEIADALADGRDHPDSCYPVVVQIGPHSSRLHLPAYSSAQTLRHKLLLAMTNIPFM